MISADLCGLSEGPSWKTELSSVNSSDIFLPTELIKAASGKFVNYVFKIPICNGRDKIKSSLSISGSMI